GGFEGALPIIFGRGFFAQLRVTPRQIHFLHDRIQRVTLTVEQLFDVAPPAEPAEGVEVLQKELATDQRSVERNGVERFLKFVFSVQPRRQRKQVIAVSVLPLRDSLCNELVAPRRVRVLEQIERK